MGFSGKTTKVKKIRQRDKMTNEQPKDGIEMLSIDDVTKSELGDSYDELRTYEEFPGMINYTMLYVHLKRKLGDLKGKRVLEFGPGYGVLLPVLANKGAEVYAIDNLVCEKHPAKPEGFIYGYGDLVDLSQQEMTPQRLFPGLDLDFDQFDLVFSRDFFAENCNVTIRNFRDVIPMDRHDASQILQASRNLSRFQIHEVDPGEDLIEQSDLSGYRSGSKKVHSSPDRIIWYLQPL